MDYNKIGFALVFAGCCGIAGFVLTYYLIGLITIPLMAWFEKKILGGLR